MVQGRKQPILVVQLTMLKVIGLTHVDANQCHQLQLGQSLTGGRWQGQEVAQVGDLRVDQVAPQFRGSLGRLGGVKAAGEKEKRVLSENIVKIERKAH